MVSNLDSQFYPEDTLDYHDFGPLDAYQIEKILLNFLEDSFNKSYTQILIITGKGKVVRPQVESLLSKSKLVKKYKKAGYFNGQDGAFEVILN